MKSKDTIRSISAADGFLESVTLYLRKALPFVCFGVPSCCIPPITILPQKGSARHFVNRSLIVHYPLMISALKIRQRKFNFGQMIENKETANLPLARKLGGIPPASEFYREICLFLLTCKSKCKFVRSKCNSKVQKLRFTLTNMGKFSFQWRRMC